MFGNNKKTELIIVCDEKSMSYANYLIQLLGQSDDEGDTVVGVKDGSVSAAIYTVKQYKNNQVKVTSNTHVLFIGNNDTTKEQAKYMTYKFNDFGMCFGWLGKRAVMYVDRTIADSEEYNRFFDYAVKYQKNFTKIIERENQNKTASGTDRGASLKREQIAKKLGKGTGIAAFVVGAMSPISTVAAATIAAPFLVKAGVDIVKEKESIKDQQYSCLTMVTYLEGLSEFLEG